ncbi:MAG: cob(I)yrinic acid a,c-diamide adenosyltransferase [Ruminiclostridium sp.]|nr:cob(I)yrinic acid a,c-diamide adenosyltransferase [Ruminiclostridium sp.]
MKSLIHIYTGNGKGKTTAAIGLGIRAYGRGFKVLMVQFLKGADTGEIHTLKKLEPGFLLYRGTEIKKFIWNMNEAELRQTARIQQDIFNYAVDAAICGGWDMVIMDEILGAVSSGMVDLNEVVQFIKDKPDNFELVLTGRNAPPELVELADYVSEIKAVKHPMEKGIPARKGIEN